MKCGSRWSPVGPSGFQHVLSDGEHVQPAQLTEKKSPPPWGPQFGRPSAAPGTPTPCSRLCQLQHPLISHERTATWTCNQSLSSGRSVGARAARARQVSTGGVLVVPLCHVGGWVPWQGVEVQTCPHKESIWWACTCSESPRCSVQTPPFVSSGACSETKRCSSHLISATKAKYRAEAATKCSPEQCLPRSRSQLRHAWRSQLQSNTGTFCSRKLSLLKDSPNLDTKW